MEDVCKARKVIELHTICLISSPASLRGFLFVYVVSCYINGKAVDHYYKDTYYYLIVLPIN